MEIYESLQVYCGTGKIETTINVEGGELVDNTEEFVEAACPGCQHWTDKSVRVVERYLEAEWGRE